MRWMSLIPVSILLLACAAVSTPTPPVQQDLPIVEPTASTHLAHPNLKAVPTPSPQLAYTPLPSYSPSPTPNRIPTPAPTPIPKLSFEEMQQTTVGQIEGIVAYERLYQDSESETGWYRQNLYLEGRVVNTFRWSTGNIAAHVRRWPGDSLNPPGDVVVVINHGMVNPEDYIKVVGFLVGIFPFEGPLGNNLYLPVLGELALEHEWIACREARMPALMAPDYPVCEDLNLSRARLTAAAKSWYVSAASMACRCSATYSSHLE